MDLFSPEFLSALAAIVVIDLVLAGDNAIVIALAARNLPKRLQTRAIFWGTFGAIAVRSAMTLVVVWLLKIPGLLLAGGLLLIWIAYKLIAPKQDDGHAVDPASSFWGAMKTIVVADAVMGLDTCRGAGAAQGLCLVVLGWIAFRSRSGVHADPGGWSDSRSSTWARRARWTAAKMIASEPLIQEYLVIHPATNWILYAAIIGGTIGYGYLRNRRLAVAAHNA
jgi:YjbE family integral membrane protein